MGDAVGDAEIRAQTVIYNSLGGDHWTQCSWNLSEMAINASLPTYYCGLTIHSTSDTVNL